MAGSWVVRYTVIGSGEKVYFARKKHRILHGGSRWYTVRTPVDAKRFFRQEQAETVAFKIALERSELLGKLVVVQWDGNAKSKP